ncbi:hypothetical protein Tco_0135194, partial [Tanacetum coccineum]
RRALFTTHRIAKSAFEDATLVVLETRFSDKTTQYESLDTTSAVSRTKIATVTPLRAKNKVVQIVVWIVDSGCSKHMTGDHSLLKNFVEKFMGIVRFRNDHFTAITGYGDYIQGNITVYHVYYIEGLGHNLFSVGQFCDGDLEVAFHSNTCYVRNLKGDDLLTGARESNLYTISFQMWLLLHLFVFSPKLLQQSHGYGTVDSHILILNPFLNDSSAESMNTLSKEYLDNLFGLMYEENFEKRSSEMSINSVTQQVHNHKDLPSTYSIIVEEHEAHSIVTTSKEQTSPISLNKDDEFNQEDSTEFDGNTLLTPYDAPDFSKSESSTTLDPSNMHEFYQVQPSTHIWTKAYPLEQVIGDLSKPVMTQNILQADSELCMYALTVSTLEPKNIKEAMSDQSWIESVQDELHQFERLDVWELVPRPDEKNIIVVKWL